MTLRAHSDKVSPAPLCPLCGSERLSAVPGTGSIAYRDCTDCGLMSLHPGHYLDREAEKAHYDTHENNPADPRYRAFLSRLARPLIGELQPGLEGLDYGSGPGPTLSVIFEEAGFSMRIYDPFYAPDPRTLSRRYDFITCSETIEHFHDPEHEFALFNDLLRPGGRLGIMSEIFPADGTFGTWWYRRDPTHVCFYREKTFEWIARRFGWEWERPARTVVLFRKRDDDPPSR